MAGMLRRIQKFYKLLQMPKEPDPPYTHLVQVGDPVLRTPAAPVDRFLLEEPPRSLREIIDTMAEIVTSNDMVGLAAPQIGVPLRIICFQMPKTLLNTFDPETVKAHDIEEIPLTFLVNPLMQVLDHKMNVYTENCGSIEGYAADVKRYNKIRVQALTQHGEHVSMTATGFSARILQHEIDHLNGVVFTDIMNQHSFKCALWKEINKFGGYVELRFFPKIK